MTTKAQRTDSETGYVVTMHQVIGTKTRIYAAYTPSSWMGIHRSLFTIDDQVHGRVGTEEVTPEIKALPVGEERSRRVHEYHKERYEDAYAAIVRCFPEAAQGQRTMGEIEVY
jgi:hypothetical protein